MLEANLPTIETALQSFDKSLASGVTEKLPIRASYLLPALGVGLFARVFRLYGQFSHWLGISERFDVDVIMPEFVRGLGIAVDTVTERKWLEHRHDVMRQSFYRFASSNSPEIDGHLIHQSLDLWSWFWTGLQTAVVFVLTGLILIAAQKYQAGAITIGSTLLLTGDRFADDSAVLPSLWDRTCQSDHGRSCAGGCRTTGISRDRNVTQSSSARRLTLAK